MGDNNWLSAREAAEYLGITKPQIFRLIKQGKLIARLDMEAPVPYYQIDKISLEKYRITPKNKGGRPNEKNG